MQTLKQNDPDMHAALKNEFNRQKNGFEMIPSENYVSKAVLQALGSIGTNKYSEGSVNKRYYGGNQFIDDIENLAVERAKKFFGVNHANVQPYSGSPANQAVCFALLKPGEKLMGLDLMFGGHLTHGWKVNFSAKYYESAQYRLGKDGLMDYNEVEAQVKKEKPKLIFCGATAYPRIYDYKRLAEIAHDVDAYFVADIAHEAGMIGSGVIPGPVGHADVITTTTHKTLRGPRGGMILCNGKPSQPLKPLPKEENPRENFPTLIDRAVFPGLQGGPHNHTTAAIGVALGEALQPEFKTYCEQILKNAKMLASELMDGGFTLVSGGTDNHLMLIDVTKNGLTGKEAEEALDKASITVNKNGIPWDERKPWDPSGIRIGTPALTTRGFKESEMKQVAALMGKVLKNPTDSNLIEGVQKDVVELCNQFPLYEDIEY